MEKLERFRLRIWDKINKHMFYRFPYIECRENGTDTLDIILKYSQTYETMQSTAVYDNNGLLVFEGDYLTDGTTLWEVRYGETHCGFYARAVAGDCMQTDSTIFSLWHLCNHHNAEKSVKVIGNIYENKEPLSKLIKRTGER